MPSIHPLSIPEIRSRIIDFVDPSQFSSLILLNRSWSADVYRRLYNRISPILYPNLHRLSSHNLASNGQWIEDLEINRLELLHLFAEAQDAQNLIRFELSHLGHPHYTQIIHSQTPGIGMVEKDLQALSQILNRSRTFLKSLTVVATDMHFFKTQLAPFTLRPAIADTPGSGLFGSQYYSHLTSLTLGRFRCSTFEFDQILFSAPVLTFLCVNEMEWYQRSEQEIIEYTQKAFQQHGMSQSGRPKALVHPSVRVLKLETCSIPLVYPFSSLDTIDLVRPTAEILLKLIHVLTLPDPEGIVTTVLYSPEIFGYQIDVQHAMAMMGNASTIAPSMSTLRTIRVDNRPLTPLFPVSTFGSLRRRGGEDSDSPLSLYSYLDSSSAHLAYGFQPQAWLRAALRLDSLLLFLLRFFSGTLEEVHCSTMNSAFPRLLVDALVCNQGSTLRHLSIHHCKHSTQICTCTTERASLTLQTDGREKSEDEVQLQYVYECFPGLQTLSLCKTVPIRASELVHIVQDHEELQEVSLAFLEIQSQSRIQRTIQELVWMREQGKANGDLASVSTGIVQGPTTECASRGIKVHPIQPTAANVQGAPELPTQEERIRHRRRFMRSQDLVMRSPDFEQEVDRRRQDMTVEECWVVDHFLSMSRLRILDLGSGPVVLP